MRYTYWNERKGKGRKRKIRRGLRTVSPYFLISLKLLIFGKFPFGKSAVREKFWQSIEAIWAICKNVFRFFVFSGFYFPNFVDSEFVFPNLIRESNSWRNQMLNHKICGIDFTYAHFWNVLNTLEFIIFV